jgi:shikimate kinase
MRIKFKTDRPLLLGPDGRILPEEILLERVLTLLKIREPFYLQADFYVSTDDKGIKETVEEILKKIEDKIA